MYRGHTSCLLYRLHDSLFDLRLSRKTFREQQMHVFVGLDFCKFANCHMDFEDAASIMVLSDAFSEEDYTARGQRYVIVFDAVGKTGEAQAQRYCNQEDVF